MEYTKIVIAILLLGLLVYVFYGNRIRYWFRQWSYGKRLEKELAGKPDRSLPSESDKTAARSVREVYAFSKEPPAGENVRYLYIRGELAGYVESDGREEALSFYKYDRFNWEEHHRSKEFMQSLLSRFRESYAELKKDEALHKKYREIIAPFTHHLPRASFTAIEDRLDIKFPEELLYCFCEMGVGQSRLLSIVKRIMEKGLQARLHFSDTFIRHLYEQHKSFSGFSEEERKQLNGEEGFEGLIGYYYETEYSSAAEYRSLPINLVRHGLETYTNKDDEPIRQVAWIDAIGESEEYLVLDTSLAGYFCSDLTFKRSEIEGIYDENPVFTHFEYADYLHTLKQEIMGRTHLIQLLLGESPA